VKNFPVGTGVRSSAFLTPEDLAAAWAYVEQHTGEIDQAIRENQEA